MWCFMYNLEIIINWSWTFGSSPRLNPLKVYLIEDTERIQFQTCIFIYPVNDIFFCFPLYREKVKMCLRVKYKKKVIKGKIQDWDSVIYFAGGSIVQ